MSGAIRPAAPGDSLCPWAFAHTCIERVQDGDLASALVGTGGAAYRLLFPHLQLELDAKATAMGWGAEAKWKGRTTRDPECELEPSSTSHGLLPGQPGHLWGQLVPPHRQKCPREEILGHAVEPCGGLPGLLWRPLRQLASGVTIETGHQEASGAGNVLLLL